MKNTSINLNYNYYFLVNKSLHYYSTYSEESSITSNSGHAEFLYKRVFNMTDFKNGIIYNLLKYGVEKKTPNYSPRKLIYE